MRTLMVAAMLCLTLLSGCTGDGSLLTAKNGLPDADGVASSWAADAMLVSVGTFEMGDEIKQYVRDALAEAQESGELEEDDLSDEDRAMLDAMLSTHDSPGDGRATFWVYVYTSESQDGLLLVLVGAGGVLHSEAIPYGWEGEFADGVDELEAIADWNIDSDEAARLAATQSDYAALEGRADAVAFSGLAMAEGTPYWVLGLVSAPVDGSEGEDMVGEQIQAIAIVDARDGALLDAQDLEDLQDLGNTVGSAADALYQEAGTLTGELTLLAPADEGSFAITQDGHEAIAVAVEVAGPTLSGVDVTITDPAGTTSTFTVPMATGLRSRGHVVLDIVPAGTWQVAVAMDPAIQHDYTVEYCTDGVSVAGGVPALEVCAEVPTSAAVPGPLGFGASEMVSRMARLMGA